jgi:hypothetical protein
MVDPSRVEAGAGVRFVAPRAFHLSSPQSILFNNSVTAVFPLGKSVGQSERSVTVAAAMPRRPSARATLACSRLIELFLDLGHALFLTWHCVRATMESSPFGLLGDGIGFRAW